MRLHFHLRRHATKGEAEINLQSWFRLQHEANDAAQSANSSRSEDDLIFDVVQCTSDGCERRRTPRKPSDAYWRSAKFVFPQPATIFTDIFFGAMLFAC